MLAARPLTPKPNARNFGGNQLLGDSISLLGVSPRRSRARSLRSLRPTHLSPLCLGLTINLHVRDAASLHQGFPWLRPAQAKFTTFRVVARELVLESLFEKKGRSVVPLLTKVPTSLSFLAPSGLPPKDSLARNTPWSVFQDGVCGGVLVGDGNGFRGSCVFPP